MAITKSELEKHMKKQFDNIVILDADKRLLIRLAHSAFS